MSPRRIKVIAAMWGGILLLLFSAWIDPHLMTRRETILGGVLAITRRETILGGVLAIIGCLSILLTWTYCLSWAVHLGRRGWIFTDIFLSGLAIILHPLFGPVGDSD
jgi:hypothetical protein